MKELFFLYNKLTMYNKQSLMTNYKVSFIMLILINLYYIVRSFSNPLILAIPISMDLTFLLFYFSFVSSLKGFKIVQPEVEEEEELDEEEVYREPSLVTANSDDLDEGGNETNTTAQQVGKQKPKQSAEEKIKQNRARKTLDISELNGKSNKERMFYFDDLLEDTYRTGETRDIVTAFSQREAERRNQLC